MQHLLTGFYNSFNTFHLSGLYTYRQYNIQQFYVLPTQLYLCDLCGSVDKEPLFPNAALTDWIL